jgi:SAM-dependent methyltransferase
VVPAILELVHPQSVVDVGCGTGGWLASFQAAGVQKILGIDGDYVDRSQLAFAPSDFHPADLTQALRVEDKFDLAMSLEVAEHLPATIAVDFVASLCRMAPVVLFGAAIPFQGGNNHVNEQWPEYWQAVFARQGYVAVDCLRWRFWQDSLVSWYYSQNMVLYVREQCLEDYPALASHRLPPGATLHRLVHPERYLSTAHIGRFAFRDVLMALPGFTAKFARWHWARFRGER